MSFLTFLKSVVAVGFVVANATTLAFAQSSSSPSLFKSSAQSAAAPSTVVTTPHVRAELLAFAPDGVQVGKPLTLGLQIQHQPQWHTYWKNPGDSGLPTQLTWTLPSGLQAGAIQWPVPKKIPIGDLMNFGYEGTVLLTVPVTVTAVTQIQNQSQTQTHVEIRLQAQWLVCKTECIPEEGEFLLKLPIQGSTAIYRAAFESASAQLPKPHTGSVRMAVADQNLELTIEQLPAAWQGKILEAFPETADIIHPAAKIVQSWQSGVWRATLPLSTQRSTSPDQLVWLVKVAGGSGNPATLASARLAGTWPQPPVSVAELSPALQAALAQNKASGQAPNHVAWLSAAYGLALLGALLGGLILNLMPCVLPVLAIKLLSFTPQSLQGTSSSATVRIEGLNKPVIYSDTTLSLRSSSALFALGMVATFMLLAATLLMLRSVGTSLGWGFQLQSPAMVLALALLFLLIGLHLFDALTLNSWLPSSWADVHFNNPRLEALASGALAVLIATPCTAPFMGASLGMAVGLPAAQALLIFLLLGVGMALPFLALSLYPALGAWLQRQLPRPGAWMNDLRHLLAWPMFATVLWLLWVYALQTSVLQTLTAALAMLMLMAFLWSLKLAPGRLRTVSVALMGLLLVLSCVRLATLQQNQAAIAAIGSPSKLSVSSWQAWTPELQASLRASGQPVLVDFTAAWCITCQVNKSTTLETAATLALLQSKQVALLKADWTRPNPAIAAELQRLGRSGLPVYALYLPGAEQPQLLPEILSPATIERAVSLIQ